MYSPGFIKSLHESCYNPDFYARIKEISLKRTIGFLFLLSLLVSLVSFLLMFFYFSKHQTRTEEILQAYDTYLPPFEIILKDNQLETTPPNVLYYFSFNRNRDLEVQKEKMSSSVFTLQVDSKKKREEFFSQLPDLSGVYVLNDAIVLYTGMQNTIVEYSTLEIPQDVAFSKETIRPHLEQYLPSVLDWARRVTLQLGTALIFFYTFISSWFLALFSSLFGMLILLIRQTPFRYSFLLQLSFYSMVPALFFMLLTHFLGISVHFLPFIIYVCFYYYGLSVYVNKQ